MVVWSSPTLGRLFGKYRLCVYVNILDSDILSAFSCSTKSRRCDYSSFIFCEVSSGGEILSAAAFSVVALSGACAVGGPGVMLSCIPVIVPMTINRITDSAVLSLLSDDAKNFVKGITYVSMGQGTLAMADFMFGDLLAGFMKGVFAALGFYVSQMDDGVGVIPSYTVVSFVNGCISMLSGFERMSARHTPMFSGAMPLYLNYIHLSQLIHPILCFAGAYMGWQIIKELRRTGISAAQSNPTALFPTAGSPNIAPQPLQPGRSLSTIGSSNGFTPFTGRGHSLESTHSVATNAT